MVKPCSQCQNQGPCPSCDKNWDRTTQNSRGQGAQGAQIAKPNGLVAVGYGGHGRRRPYKDCSIWLSALLWIFIIVVFMVMVAAIAKCASK